MSGEPFPAARRVGAVAAALLTCSLSLLGCGTPPELRSPPPAPMPSGSAIGSVTPPPWTVTPPTTAPMPTGSARPSFAEGYALDCAGYPTGAQILARVRRAGLLPSRSAVTVRTGPLCAGSWQYTVINVPGRDPLVVVTEGSPQLLNIVTAGSDVCSVPVRVGAPAGIQTAAGCS